MRFSKLTQFAVAAILAIFTISVYALDVPEVTGNPIIVQHLGKLSWPQDDPTTIPYLTQLVANDINDLHGDVSCDLIITTPGNYHMALRDAMKGRPDLGFAGLQAQLKAMDVSVCWSTSPPVGPEQIEVEDLQFKNIHLKGRPALAMGPGKVMNRMVANGQVIVSTRQPFLRNRGNVILAREEAAEHIHNICDLGGRMRIVTPNPTLEPGSFGNFSSTIFNIAAQNELGCDPTKLFNSIFSQDVSHFKTDKFDKPYDIAGVLSVFGIDLRHHYRREGKAPRWIASSRIMHRDIPYALCHNEADAGLIFYHLAKYMTEELAKSGCELKIVPLGGTAENPLPMDGNRVATLYVAKVTGDFPLKVQQARDVVYDFITSSPLWTQILADHGIDDPTPNY